MERRRPKMHGQHAARIALGITLLGAGFGGARACVHVTTDGIPLHWAQRQLTYTLDLAGKPEALSTQNVEQTFQRAFGAWIAQTRPKNGHGGCTLPFHITRAAVRACSLNDPNDGVNCFSFVPRKELWAGQDPGAYTLALTLVHYRSKSGVIVDVDSEYKAYGFVRWSAAPACDGPAERAAGQSDLLGTATHEVGHFFGLGHSTDPSATMFATTGDGECAKRTLARDDIDCICATYKDYPPGDAVAADAGGADAATGGPDIGPNDRDTGPDGAVARRPRGCGGGSGGGGALWLAALAFMSALGARRRSRRGPSPSRARS